MFNQKKFSSSCNKWNQVPCTKKKKWILFKNCIVRRTRTNGRKILGVLHNGRTRSRCRTSSQRRPSRWSRPPSRRRQGRGTPPPLRWPSSPWRKERTRTTYKRSPPKERDDVERMKNKQNRMTRTPSSGITEGGGGGGWPPISLQPTRLQWPQ